MVYYQKLDETSKNGGDPTPFIEYALQGFVDGLDEQINYLTEQQLRIVWKNYVYDKYREHKSASKKRQRDLLLEISEASGPVPVADIRAISSRVAKLYENLTSKAVSRDVNALHREDLLVLDEKGYSPNWGMLMSFYP